MARNALGLEFGSAAQLSKRPGSVWNCLWGHTLKRSPGIIRKSRVSYPVPGFLSSATWPLLPKKYYNGLNQTKPRQNFSIQIMMQIAIQIILLNLYCFQRNCLLLEGIDLRTYLIEAVCCSTYYYLFWKRIKEVLNYKLISKNMIF